MGCKVTQKRTSEHRHWPIVLVPARQSSQLKPIPNPYVIVAKEFDEFGILRCQASAVAQGWRRLAQRAKEIPQALPTFGACHKPQTEAFCPQRNGKPVTDLIVLLPRIGREVI